MYVVHTYPDFCKHCNKVTQQMTQRHAVKGVLVQACQNGGHYAFNPPVDVMAYFHG